MRFYYITNSRLPTEKAFGYGISKMCEALGNNGCEVILVIPRREKVDTDSVFEYYGVKRKFRIKSLWSLDLYRFMPNFSKLAFALQSLTFFLSILFMPVQSGDILYTRDLFTLPILRLKGRFVYLEIHLLQDIHRRFGKLFYFANKIFTTTNELKKQIVKFGVSPSDIVVAHDAVDFSEFGIEKTLSESRKETSLPIDKKIIGYTGNFKAMGMDKGISNIIKALPLVCKQMPDLLFVAVGGSDSDIVEYQLLADKFSVTDHVRLLPRVHVKNLPVWQQAFDLLLMCPSNTDYFAHHVSPLKMFEYMAANRPIIASDLPGFREVLDETNSVLVDSENPKKLADAIIHVLSNKTFADSIALAAKDRVHMYTWDKRAKLVLTTIG